jgi:hypothetical protein
MRHTFKRLVRAWWSGDSGLPLEASQQDKGHREGERDAEGDGAHRLPA